MKTETHSPIYILKGKNWLRLFFIFLLISIIFFGIYTYKFIGLIALFPSIIAAFGLLTIQFPFLYVYEDTFVLKKKSILKHFSSHQTFKYQDIKAIKFAEGYTNRAQLILQTILGNGAYGGFSKPDRIIIQFQNNTKKIIYRFGNREAFEKSFKLIQKRITTKQNSC